MFKKVSLGILLILVIIITSCSSNKILEYGSSEEALKEADAYFEAGKYRKAIPFYQKIVNESSTVLMAEAQMKLADCYFNKEDYIDARFEYEEFIRQFSNHPNTAKAFFQIGICYFELSLPAHYDQTETFSAIDAFNEYLERYPFDDRKNEAIEYINKCRMKLLEKKFWNGYAYYKISDFPSALMYFEEITELNNINETDKKARYFTTLMYITRKDLIKAESEAKILIERYPDSKESTKITKKIEKLKKKLQNK